ncbi:unnamed protein product [Fraxinus pennsylvanica]|uniref:DUF4283 domain-containing protein n=1 Tax=Fraxinus pennsylvanica TaxID=56036 RepID=A0AAD2E7N6_9LAMI|nr:unnamed protein product [Fraxinus pennsylvanica]
MVFDKQLVLLKKFDGSLQPRQITMKEALFWVRLHDLPFGGCNEKIGKKTGEPIGEVMEVDLLEGECAWGGFMRVQRIGDGRKGGSPAAVLDHPRSSEHSTTKFMEPLSTQADIPKNIKEKVTTEFVAQASGEKSVTVTNEDMHDSWGQDYGSTVNRIEDVQDFRRQGLESAVAVTVTGKEKELLSLGLGLGLGTIKLMWANLTWAWFR